VLQQPQRITFFKIEFINALYYYTEDQFVRYTIRVPMQSFFFFKETFLIKQRNHVRWWCQWAPSLPML